MVRASSARAGLAQLARIVLLAAEGLPNAEIARRTGVCGPTVLTWRNRYVAGGVDALGDLARPGRPPVHDEVAVVVTTLAPPFRPIRHAWRVEVAGRLGRSRSLAKSFENTTTSATGWLQVACLATMLR